MSNLFEQSVPVVIHKLNNFKHICQVGEKHAKDSEIDEYALTGFRLYPDMMPFTSQVNIATDIVCGMTARLTGKERIKLEDGASNFSALIQRIDTTIDHLKSQQESDYEGSAFKQVVIQTPFGELSFTGAEYLANFIFPNLYFHITTAYNILRHNGVKLGKLDYLRGG